MRKLLREIRSQDEHVRQILFVLSVVISVSLVGTIWFRSFQKEVFVLLNPDQESQQRFLAEQEDTKSVLASIGKLMSDARGLVFSVFSNDGRPNEVIISNNPEPAQAHPLPLSGDR